MRTIYKILLAGLIGIVSFGCNESYLERPSTDQLDASVYFSSATELEAYINGLYDMLPNQDVYQEDASSDNILPLTVDARVMGTRIVPVDKGSGGWNWSDLRSINFFLDNYHVCPDEDAKKHYGGIAKYFRAWFYYTKVKRFGDVPWYGHVLEAGSDELYKPRDSRVLVMDSVLNDLNDAIAMIDVEVELNRITKYTALALKARVCLFEGTFRKYHGLENYQKFLEEAASAAGELISSGAYSIYRTGGSSAAYGNLFNLLDQNSTETILAKQYHPDYTVHNTGYLMTSPTQGAYGMTKDMINSYLMADGSRFTDQAGYEAMEFYEEMQNRDPRLMQTTAGPDFTAYGESSPEPVDLSGTTTGYRVIKSLSSKDNWDLKMSKNDIILFRYAEALLVYAEAKAELGTLSQDDLDLSVNKLRDRVGLPHLKLNVANANPDSFLEGMYPNVEQGPNKGVILEIRRERRIELFMEGLRWDDLMRWKAGKKLEQAMVGIYFSGLGAHDFNNDGQTDVYLHDGDASGAPVGTPTIINVNTRKLTNGASGYLNPFDYDVIFDETKDYLCPIPIEDIALNKNLLQNPNWDD